MNAPLAKEQIALLMSNSLTYRDSPVQRPATARPTIAQRLSNAVTALLTLPRRRAVIDELSRLSDRELADIGLSRAELRLVFDPKFSAARGR